MSVSDGFKQVVGRRLREHRDAAGLRQSDVATALDIHPMRVSEWERGVAVPNTEQVTKIAAMLGVSVDAVIGGVTADNVITLPETQDGTPVQSETPDTAA